MLTMLAGMMPFHSDFDPRRSSTSCFDRLRNAAATSKAWTMNSATALHLVSVERSAQTVRGDRDWFTFIPSFYHERSNRCTRVLR
jgi:hypothetical protein